jgi:hypothetical protein
MELGVRVGSITQEKTGLRALDLVHLTYLSSSKGVVGLDPHGPR